MSKQKPCHEKEKKEHHTMSVSEIQMLGSVIDMSMDGNLRFDRDRFEALFLGQQQMNFPSQWQIPLITDLISDRRKQALRRIETLRGTGERQRINNIEQLVVDLDLVQKELKNRGQEIAALLKNDHLIDEIHELKEDFTHEYLEIMGYSSQPKGIVALPLASQRVRAKADQKFEEVMRMVKSTFYRVNMKLVGGVNITPSDFVELEQRIDELNMIRFENTVNNVVDRFRRKVVGEY